jgi:hypothetical protein
VASSGPVVLLPDDNEYGATWNDIDRGKLKNPVNLVKEGFIIMMKPSFTRYIGFLFHISVV